ncbi:hypothetical protein NW762_011005 [Fusarium torreyae]|uniref:Berberine/berberine-like domain-containing protein n=1 Tax=Fusarium torreyae TaxID=1237075 RepID=A0A9W8RQG9_9HYPO|nr:hypothetical protein NW762_011005 [Fusarium torreyae]
MAGMGGCSGNHGVIISATIKAHPETRVSGAKFLVVPPTDKTELIYDGINVFHAVLSKIADSGVMIIYLFFDLFLQVPAMTAYNKTEAKVKKTLTPLADSFSSLFVTFRPDLTQCSNYYEDYDHYRGPLPAGNIQAGTQVFGGRLLPRNKLNDFSPTARRIEEMGVIYIGVGLDVSKFGQNNTNSKITDEIQPVVEAATPSPGAYINEADFQQKSWRETFYGVNYTKLLEIKKKYHPQSLFYTTVGVGSEALMVGNDGRMCKARR